MPYSIHVQPSSHTFPATKDETILEAALRHGYRFPYGCRNGSCGLCKGRLISGQIDCQKTNLSALSKAEEAAGFVLLCLARPRSNLIVEVQEVESMAQIPIKILPCRVARMQRLSHEVMGLWLKLPRTERLQFLAGQYVDILLKDNHRRSFSLANAPHNDEFLELHIRHYPHGRFSDYVFTEMHENELLRIRGPLGSFVLNEASTAPMIFVAGGTGFAPIKGIIEHSLAIGLARPIHLYWGVRSRRDLYMDQLARSWATTYAHICYTPVLSEPQSEDSWHGRIGLVHEAVLKDFEDLSGYEVYTSGPPIMVKAIQKSFQAQGLPVARIYSDAFEPAVH